MIQATPAYEIKNTTEGDLPVIFDLFEHSIAYQQKHGYPVWKHYDRDAIRRDIERGHQYKIMVDGIFGMVFSVCYNDKVIWRERDQGDAVYLHRIVVNPELKGQRLFGVLLEWIIQHATQKSLRYVRMDTWSANPTIIQYYQSFGFVFIENFVTPDSLELPVHNRNLGLTLLEYPL